jgi:hypothetical protein
MKTLLPTIAGVAALLLSGCGSGPSMSGTGMTPMAGSSAAPFAGTWAGSLSESGGSMMGSRAMGSMMNGPMMGRATWSLSEDGTGVTGYMDLAPLGGIGRMQMTGAANGNSWTVTMTIAAGMMGDASACSSTAVGTCQVSGTTMTCSYSGANSCTGPFSGTVTMTRVP